MNINSYISIVSHC